MSDLSKLSILIIGSYNGQDSFGDKCLARCVAQQIRETCNFSGHQSPNILSHIDGNLETSQGEIPEVEFSTGISLLYWAWNNKLRHLHLPTALQRFMGVITLPVYLMATQVNRRKLQRIKREIRESPLVYFYGGTQLSEQWFWYNFIPLMITAFLCKLYQVPLYFGPQQYGPENNWQRWFLRTTVKYLVRDIRVRNKNCLELLNLSPEKLCYDEVFSCAIRYPVVKHHVPPKNFILVNMRGTNFLRDGESREFEVFSNLLVAVKNQLGLPFKLFQMSGSSFCDDTKLLGFLQSRPEFSDIHLEVLPLVVEEAELIKVAIQAYGTISMSFHGCILSMIGGCPSVPVTSGDYYDYKYIDFDKYSGEQGTPLITLGNLDVKQASATISDYFSKYSPVKTAIARERAAQQMKYWYKTIV
ncbi:hypothetical protein CRD_02443 [Raphidiopsis brookii D9]|nr:hypothetical protein CRD_02443 [Raphidiopsis brookii D9]